MRIVFAGTPHFAEQALAALIAAGHQLPLVLTQPERPAGRGMKLVASPVNPSICVTHRANLQFQEFFATAFDYYPSVHYTLNITATTSRSG